MEYFKQYFPDNFFNEASQYTNMYAVSKTGNSINTNASELKKFFGMNVLIGCLSYPRLRMYWSRQYSLSSVTDCISRNRFQILRNYFHLIDNNSPPPERNALWKVQPIINSFRNVCLKLPRNNTAYSIDEQMIPFSGRCSLKQYVKNKPRPVGLKNFVLTTSYGLVLDFEVYQGNRTRLINPELGLGPGIVLRLVESLPAGSFIFFDRYFSTIPLFGKLQDLNLQGCGTIMLNRIKGIEFLHGAKFKRGESEEFVSSDDKIVVVNWKDNKPITLASTCFGIAPEETVSRWSKNEKKYISVTCPSIVRNYNRCMGGVDICDQLMEYYRNSYKTRKWTWKFIAHFIDLAVVNSWVQYNHECKANKVGTKRKDLLQFKLEIAEALMTNSHLSRPVLSDSEEEAGPAIKRSKFFNPPAKLPCDDKRYDGFEHFPIIDNIVTPRICRMDNCKGRTKLKCEKCGVYLCLTKERNCFKNFHFKG